MGASEGILGYTISIVVFELCQSQSYEIRCPKHLEWSFKASANCGNVLEYFCLLDDNANIYTEFCKRNPDISRDITWKKGQKCVVRGNLDGELCSTERYQPFKFRTDGNSDCAYKKSHCQDEGMVTYQNGSTTSDTWCRCDHTKGFAFVSKTKQSCYCNPSKEDCSCYKKECKNNFQLSSDYNCIFLDSQKDKSACTSLDIRPLVKNTGPNVPDLKNTNTYVSSENDMVIVGKKHHFINLSITALIFFIAIITILLWKCNEPTIKCTGNTALSDEEKDIRGNTALSDEEKNIRDQRLFKMKLKVNYKDIITTINSNEIADSLTLSDIEKTSVQSFIGKIKRNKALLEVVFNRAHVLYTEFINVLRQNNQHLADKIENTEDTGYQDVKEEELEKNYNEKIPEDMRKSHDRAIQGWISNKEMIIETQASSAAYQRLKESNLVVVVGPPGIGKSSIIRHIALKFVEENATEDHDIIPVVIKPSHITEFHNCSRNQIFVSDDFCGKVEDDNKQIDNWNRNIKTILNIICGDGHAKMMAIKSNSKMLISCNRCVYMSKMFEPLQKRLQPFVLDLSSLPLTDLERENMIAKYAPEAKLKDFYKGKEYNDFYFPFLCKLSTGKKMDEIEQLFSDPLNTITKDLKKIQIEEKYQFCAIALCTLFDNNFKTEWLKRNPKYGDDRVEQAVAEMFNLDLKDSNLERIQKQFSVDMHWLNKSDDDYYYVHDEVFNIALELCGSKCANSFIKHAPSSFIAKRFNFFDKKNGQITLSTEDYESYFNRLFSDLENGITYSTFENSQMTTEFYRKQLIDYLKSRKGNLKKVLDQIKFEPVKEEPYEKLCFKVQTPLIVCTMQGYEDMVYLLLSMECDVNANVEYGKSALYYASVKDYFTIVQMLVEHKADIDLCDSMKMTPLHAACEEGHSDIAKYLILNKADISRIDRNNNTPLHLACVSGKIDIVKLLISKTKEELDQVEYSGKTPIIVASFHGKVDVVKYLLELDPEQVNDKDYNGLTPLHAACVNGFIETVNVLLQKTSDICHLDNDKCTALFIACKKGYSKIAKALLEVGSKIIDICNRRDESPLYIACVENRTEIVKLLISEGADINKRDKANESPIYVACDKGYTDIVKILLESKAAIDTDFLPLHAACKAGNLNIVKLLQAYKDCSLFKNKWNETALDIAQKVDHKDISIFLKSRKENEKNMEKGNSVDRDRLRE